MACVILALMCAMTAALLAGIVTPAMAASATRSARVGYADLDLSRSEGRTALDRRVRRVAQDLCGSDRSVIDLRGQRAIRRCVTGAVASAAPQVAAAVDRHSRQRLAGHLLVAAGGR